MPYFSRATSDLSPIQRHCNIHSDARYCSMGQQIQGVSVYRPGGQESFPSKTVGHVSRAQGRAASDNCLISSRDGCASKVLRLARRACNCEARDIPQVASERVPRVSCVRSSLSIRDSRPGYDFLKLSRFRTTPFLRRSFIGNFMPVYPGARLSSRSAAV